VFFFTTENFQVELDSTVGQTDNYYYIGVANESYSFTGSCGCCNPANFYYIQCDGSTHMSGSTTYNTAHAWHGQPIQITIKVYLATKQIYFLVGDRTPLGPYTLSGSNFRVAAGHCNSGNGNLKIVSCNEID